MEPVYENIAAFFRVFLGEYVPVSYSSDGIQIIPAGMAGVDWSYLVRALAFLLVVYCVFRLIGGKLCK